MKDKIVGWIKERPVASSVTALGLVSLAFIVAQCVSENGVAAVAIEVGQKVVGAFGLFGIALLTNFAVNGVNIFSR